MIDKQKKAISITNEIYNKYIIWSMNNENNQNGNNDYCMMKYEI